MIAVFGNRMLTFWMTPSETAPTAYLIAPRQSRRAGMGSDQDQIAEQVGSAKSFRKRIDLCKLRWQGKPLAEVR